MPLPIIGGLVSAGLSIGKKLLGKAVSKAAKGKLLGSGGGKEILKTVTKAVGAGTAVTVASNPIIKMAQRQTTAVTKYGGDYDVGEPIPRGYSASGRRYRRMNPMNHRALRRAVRRLEGAERLFRKVFTISGGKLIPKKKRRS